MANCNFCGKEIFEGFIIEGSGEEYCEGSKEDGTLGECVIQQMIKDGETEESARAIFKANQLIMDDEINLDFDSEFMATLTDIEREKVEEIEEEFIFWTTFDDEWDEDEDDSVVSEPINEISRDTFRSMLNGASGSSIVQFKFKDDEGSPYRPSRIGIFSRIVDGYIQIDGDYSYGDITLSEFTTILDSFEEKFNTVVFCWGWKFHSVTIKNGIVYLNMENPNE